MLIYGFSTVTRSSAMVILFIEQVMSNQLLVLARLTTKQLIAFPSIFWISCLRGRS